MLDFFRFVWTELKRAYGLESYAGDLSLWHKYWPKPSEGGIEIPGGRRSVGQIWRRQKADGSFEFCQDAATEEEIEEEIDARRW